MQQGYKRNPCYCAIPDFSLEIYENVNVNISWLEANLIYAIPEH